MDSPFSNRSLKRVAEGGHWRESKQVLFPMTSVLRTVYSSAPSYFPGTDKEERVLEKWHKKEENNTLDPLKLNIPWHPWRRKWLPTPVLLPSKSTDSGAWRLQSMGLQSVRYNWTTFTFQWKVMLYHIGHKGTNIWDKIPR